MKFPQYVSTSERTVSVVGMIDKESTEETTEQTSVTYQDGKGYIDENENIWIYCGLGKPKNANAYPYFWINAEGQKEFSDPSELMRKAFSISNMVDMSVIKIIDHTDPNLPLFDEKEINDMNAAAAFYVPIINESDDFLKKIVKMTIIEKGIDINRLKGKANEKYIIPNMKAALQNKTKMSVIYFCCWMNLLGCDFEVTILDNGMDQNDPLKNPLVYQSNRDTTSSLVEGELIDLNTGKYVQKEEDDDDDID